MGQARCRVLFFAEGATLAHVARPWVLALGLDANRYEVTFARPPNYAWLTRDGGVRVVDLECQDSSTFVRRLELGLPLFTYKRLQSYVEDDLALIDEIRPDVIVADFRLSLTVSARLRHIPYITIGDAYWSPDYDQPPPLPVFPLSRIVPTRLAESVFRALVPSLFWAHSVPIEHLRRHHGLPSLGHDLRKCYTDADLELYANFRELFPEVGRSATADFIGPVSWSPPDREDLEIPDGDGPLVYVAMGSSGDPGVLTSVIPELEAIGARVMVASGGKSIPAGLGSSSVRIYDWLPGDQLCRVASLVVCNGGSPTTNQALTNAVPVLGITRNMDQMLNMNAIVSAGVGVSLRSDRCRRPVVGEALTTALDLRSDENTRARLSQLQGNSRVLGLASFIDGLSGRGGANP
jgi:UDP:flavonoid glycosyltransferase YjiC (YdhE family)